ncbi:hypothetical protein HR52_23835 [Aeromonas hydrophila]|nr:hypothetical protein HR52_23835 [Aeromonas hydrophila]
MMGKIIVRAAGNQFCEWGAARQYQSGCNLGQGQQHELPLLHAVMGNDEAFMPDDLIAKQQQIEIQGSRPPSLILAHTSLFQLDAL